MMIWMKMKWTEVLSLRLFDLFQLDPKECSVSYGPHTNRTASEKRWVNFVDFLVGYGNLKGKIYSAFSFFSFFLFPTFILAKSPVTSRKKERLRIPMRIVDVIYYNKEQDIQDMRWKISCWIFISCKWVIVGPILLCFVYKSATPVFVSMLKKFPWILTY